MKNEEIIMKTRINLMNNRQLGTTGKLMDYVTEDGELTQIDEPAEIHTYVGWKRKGYQVPKGTKARVFIPIWNYTTDNEGNTVMIQRNAPFFLPDQVVKIEDETEAVM